jgi:hypothetical protein
MAPNGLLPSVPIRVIGVVRGRPTKVFGIRDFGEPGAVRLGSQAKKNSPLPKDECLEKRAGGIDRPWVDQIN